MPARVLLIITKGIFKGQTLAYEDRGVCIVGKEADCAIRLPLDDQHRTISRHHCLFDINPPDVRVRDFGSRNGTFINGNMIGRRDPAHKRDQPLAAFPEVDLRHGDEVQLGKQGEFALRVEIHTPPTCSTCGKDLPLAATMPHHPGARPLVCEDCRQRTLNTQEEQLLGRMGRICVRCGKDTSKEASCTRLGEYVCAACKANPRNILHKLLEKAKSGSQELAAIQGYQIIKELGQGGMGAVFLARHEETGRPMALKVMLPQVALNERSKQLFIREVETTKLLQHPHVVQLGDFGCSEGAFFFTMEYCDAGSIDHLLRQRGGTLPLPEAGPLIVQALTGLEYAHQVVVPRVQLADGSVGQGIGLVHRDIKPHNIFLSRQGGGLVAKIGDYGLAKAFDTAGLSGLTWTGAVAGTPCFMPRQQVINFRFAKPEVDVWAMAATLYFLLTARFPRDFPPDQDMWKVVLQTNPVPIRQRLPNLPQRVAEVIDIALVDQPEIPFKSAAEFRTALTAVL